MKIIYITLLVTLLKEFNYSSGLETSDWSQMCQPMFKCSFLCTVWLHVALWCYMRIQRRDGLFAIRLNRHRWLKTFFWTLLSRGAFICQRYDQHNRTFLSLRYGKISGNLQEMKWIIEAPLRDLPINKRGVWEMSRAESSIAAFN